MKTELTLILAAAIFGTLAACSSPLSIQHPASSIDHTEPTEFPKLTEPAETVERAIQPVTARNAKGQFETPRCVHGIKASSTFQQWDCPDGCRLQTPIKALKP